MKTLIHFFSFFGLEAVAQRCSVKKVFSEISQNSQENTCARVSILIKLFIKKETLAQVFSCEFCEISKNTFFYRTPLVAASVDLSIYFSIQLYSRKLLFENSYPLMSYRNIEASFVNAKCLRMTGNLNRLLILNFSK